MDYKSKMLDKYKQSICGMELWFLLSNVACKLQCNRLSLPPNQTIPTHRLSNLTKYKPYELNIMCKCYAGFLHIILHIDIIHHRRTTVMRVWNNITDDKSPVQVMALGRQAKNHYLSQY